MIIQSRLECVRYVEEAKLWMKAGFLVRFIHHPLS